MQITHVDAFALRFQTERASEQQGPYYSMAPEGWRSIYSRHPETTVVRITTSDGIIGYGEAQSPVSPRTSKTIVEDLCRPILIGKDPFDVEYLWQRMFTSMRERGHYTGFFIDALDATLRCGTSSDRQPANRFIKSSAVGIETGFRCMLGSEVRHQRELSSKRRSMFHKVMAD